VAFIQGKLLDCEVPSGGAGGGTEITPAKMSKDPERAPASVRVRGWPMYKVPAQWPFRF
jgi:hypothetical protein